jgi:acyl transferase domain-containing protein
MSTSADRIEQMSPMQKAVFALKELRAQLDELELARTEPIAIVGLGCRFPGGADSPDNFWRLLHEGTDAVTQTPTSRGWVALGGFLPDIDRFDALFFGIAPREALTMDPQQRLLLEVCWESLEDAAIAADGLSGQAVGVFVGVAPNEYSRHVSDPEQIDSHVLTGNAVSVAAGRISYLLGLHGPTLAIDTACSSSLVAVHLACQSLRNGECRMALAGGVNVLLAPESMIALTEMRALSPDGKCKTFDASANGYVRGEGCGIVVLKRLSQARQDGDRILALIRGSAVNHDGRSASLTAPNGAAQQAVIRAALDSGRVDPAQVGYVEAHGTGTPLGDPIEVRSLASVYGGDRTKDRPLRIGSVKTNLGHLEAAAGIAGVIKVVLALQHDEIPPHLHFHEPNPHLSWNELPIEVTSRALSWPRGSTPRLAGLSSFGFSGTNAHAIIEEAPPVATGGSPHLPQLCALSARTPEALREQAKRWARHLEQHPALSLADVAYTAAVGRTSFPHRLAIVASTIDEARTKLNAFVSGERIATDGQGPLDEVARKFVRGETIDWRAIMPPGSRRIALPTYPFERQSFWLEPANNHAVSAFVQTQAQKQSLQGQRLFSPLRQQVFESFFDVHRFPFLTDHRVHGKVVVAGACHLALTLGALQEARGAGPWVLREVEFPQALILNEGGTRMQAILDPMTNEDGRFQVFASDSEEWTLHAAGSFERGGSVPLAARGLELVQSRERQDGASFYTTLADHGVELGRRFRWIEETWRGDGEALCQMRIPQDDEERSLAPLYPGLADSCVQAVIVAMSEASDSSDPYIPVGVERLWFGEPARTEMWVHATLHARQAHGIEGDVVLFESDGRVVARLEKLRFRRAPRQLFLAGKATRADDLLYQMRWRTQEAPSTQINLNERWLIISDDTTQLVQDLRQQGATHCRCEEVEAALAENPRAVVFIATESSASPVEREQRRLVETVLRLVKSLAARSQAPQLWLVTRGAMAVDGEKASLTLALLWGLGRTIALEHPELRCSCIDLDPTQSGDEAQRLIRELTGADGETQIAFRNGTRLVARLTPATTEPVLEVPEGQPCWLDKGTMGALEGMTIRALDSQPPAAHEVRIRVHATGLNFRDVLNVLGLYPGEAGPLGLECYGVIEAMGAHVQGFQVGQPVVAMASGSFRSLVTTDARLVAPKPMKLSDEEAATIPVVFLTAHHAFKNLARLQRGERVLIHAAAGGVGLAALQLARQLGAEVYATSSQPKHDYLRSLGVRHLFDSRSLSFADDVRQATGGEGVHVVLNSLAGEFIPASLKLLAAGGRFVEIGKTDIWDHDRVRALRPDVAYFTLALDRMGVENPAFVGEMLRELLQRFEADVLQPLPHRDYPMPRAREAFRFMASGRHVGKIVITQAAAKTALVKPDASYLITGGLGALGLEVARWLSKKGARHLVLVGRRGPNEEAKQTIRAIEDRGAHVHICQGDVGEEDVAGKILAEVKSSCPPLRGIIHAAGVLDDGVLLEQSWQRFEKVFAPKVRGAWNLHELTRDAGLDFFVLFSSAAALLGSPGQGNYAAANSLLDVLAHQRREQCLPAVSINWGPWQDRGMAANLGGRQQQRWASQGLVMIEPRQGLDALERILESDMTQVAVLPIDRSRLPESVPPLWSELRQHAGQTQRAGFMEELKKAPSGNRAGLLVAFLREQALRILGLPASHPLANGQPLNELGLDSLLAVDLRNAVGAGLGRQLPATVLYNYPSIDALAGWLLGELFPPETAAEGRIGNPAHEEAAMQSEIEQLSEGELDDLLAQFADQHLKGTEG